MLDRRNFLNLSAAAAVATAARQTTKALAQNTADDKQHPLIIFAKPLEHFDFPELGRRLSSIGVQGIEATLRAGGQIAPQHFAEQLPRLTEALNQHDQRVVIAASDINQADQQTERQLQQFAAAKIPYLRMQYYRYNYSQPLLPQLDNFAKQATELAELCKSQGVKALYQNHAGKQYVGAALWDLQQVLQEVDPEWLQVAFDIRHAALELSQSWPSGHAVVRPHIGAIYVKDVSWIDNQPQNVPLGEGIAKPVWDGVLQAGLIGPVSLHVEYLDHRSADLQEQRWTAVTQDVATLRRWLKRENLR